MSPLRTSAQLRKHMFGDAMFNCHSIYSSIRLFADDTSLYIIVDNPFQAAEQLNLDLQKIHRWAAKWLVTFNPGKSESILLSRKHNKPFHPPVLMDQSQITEVESHKHLGVIFSNDCTWHDNLELIKSKAWKRIHVMRKLNFNWIGNLFRLFTFLLFAHY